MSSKVKGVEYFNPSQYMYDLIQCVSGKDEMLYYRDDNHISIQGLFLFKDDLKHIIDSMM
jgi:hypothetical protein